LAAGITSAALAASAAVGSGASVLLTLMSMSKLKIGAACALLVAGATTTTVLQHRNNATLRTEIETLRQQAQEIRRLREESQRRAANNTNAEEPARLESERTELLQVRGQVGVLRSQLAQIQTETIRRNPIGRAIVRAIRGTAQFSDRGQGWYDLTVGKVLSSSFTIRTGVDSGVDLFLGENGPTVRLLADTTLGLDKLDFDRTGPDVVTTTLLDLKTGAIQANIKAMAQESKYEVKTPFSACSLRDAEYHIKADGTITIMRGSATVIYRDKNGTSHTRSVNAGETFQMPDAPSAPKTTQP